MESAGLRTGWQPEESQLLWQEIQRAMDDNAPLKTVFEKMGAQLHRKPNSVRNFYYMQLRPRTEQGMRRAAPFLLFSEEEIRTLIKNVLRAKAEGKSVRACVMALSGGDKAQMLRLQNKYRSILTKRPQLIAEISEELSAEGIVCPIPTVKCLPANTSVHASFRGYEAALRNKDASILALYRALDDTVFRTLKGDIARCDRLKVQRDMALMQWEDMSIAVREMLGVCKELCAGALSQDGLRQERDRLCECVCRMENALSGA